MDLFEDSELLTSDFTPDSNIIHKENDKYLILIGSLCSMISNKRINQTAYTIFLLENREIRTLLQDITGAKSVQGIIMMLLTRYPQLGTSKTITNYITENREFINGRTKY